MRRDLAKISCTCQRFLNGQKVLFSSSLNDWLCTSVFTCHIREYKSGIHEIKKTNEKKTLKKHNCLKVLIGYASILKCEVGYQLIQANQIFFISLHKKELSAHLWRNLRIRCGVLNQNHCKEIKIEFLAISILISFRSSFFICKKRFVTF